jgi:hypothetical protein
MAEARGRDEWSRTASLMALLANCHRDPKKTRVFKPRQFYPFSRRSKPLKVPLSALREVFVAGRPPGYGRPGQADGGK